MYSSETNHQTVEQSPVTSPDQAQTDVLVTCQHELALWKDQYLHLNADFDNFRKRTEREKVNWIKMAQISILHDLLGIVDDFDRAFSDIQKKESSSDSQLFVGFELIKKSLAKLLQKYDVQEIKDNEIFNPEYHEAVEQVDSPEHISGSIIAVLQKGYIFKDQVLRPAKVSVAQ
jgi:molecular chaperone GrpE